MSAPVHAACAPVRVTLRDLGAAYPHSNGEGPVLSGVDLDLAPGQRLAVAGASGSGKSTLLHVLAGLLAPSTGAAEIDGCDAASASGRAAYMFQDDLLLPWKSVLGNTVFAASVARGSGEGSANGRGAARAGRTPRRGRQARATREAEARGLLEEFGLGEVVDDLPGRLSGGMRQRAALARTLMLGRGLILLDEPFGSLDTLTRAEMQRWLLDVMDTYPATWVLVTHDVREAVLLCDRVVVLGGRPAQLQYATEVGLSTAERRDLAASGPAGESRPPDAVSQLPAAALEQAVVELHGRLSDASQAAIA